MFTLLRDRGRSAGQSSSGLAYS